MHNIIIAENSSSDCFDSIVYSFLKYYGLDYEAYNTKYFYTEYYNVSDHCMMRGMAKNDALNQIYNINLICQDRGESSEELSKFIDASLSNMPVGIFIDPYDCFWSPFYRKSHFSHCLLIVDADYQNKKYVCFDVHYNQVGYVAADMEMILKNYTSYFLFDLKKIKEVQVKQLFDIIRSQVNRYQNNIADKISDLYRFFTESNRKTIFSDNLETSFPLISLMMTAEDKRHFAIALRYIEKRLGESLFHPIYTLLSDSVNAFSILRSVLVKYEMTGVLKKDRLKSLIEQIYIIDDNLISQMKKILKEVGTE